MGGELQARDFRETAPPRARPGMYLDSQGKPVENASLVGPLATGVPGSPAGLWELQRRYGRLPWPKVVEPARRLAAEGFRVGRYLHDGLGGEENHKLLLRFPETVKMWLPNPTGGNAGRSPTPRPA